MWGESSQHCENNCQCSGLITDSFRINSGNGATKRKQEEARSSNFKQKMNPHTLDFKSPNTPSKRKVLGEITNSFSPVNSPLQRLMSDNRKTSPINRLINSERKSPLMDKNNLSPVTTRSFKHSTNKISRIFEERTRFKMSNKENESSLANESFVKLDLEEDARDAFGEYYNKETISNWSMTKLDFTDALQSNTFKKENQTKTDLYVPEKDMETDLDPDFETLHDLEAEFDNDNFDQCTKYEIISTDSPNIISRGRSSSARKVTSSNFVFGAPLAENEQSTSFNKTVNATRMLNFEDEGFTFPSPAAKKTTSIVKKSLKFHEATTTVCFEATTPVKNPLRHEKSDSSIGSMVSPCSSHIRLFSSESTTSMESGFISELEEPFLELEDISNSPKLPNFNDLLSGQIKESVITERNFLKRPPLHRSLSFNPEPKSKINLFAIEESPRRSQKREFAITEDVSNKKMKSEGPSLMENIGKLDNGEKPRRPVLQRAFSENHATIMSALARSAVEPDLIADFSLPYALPLIGGDHADLKSISCDTLAALIKGEYENSIQSFQVIDCRYPYEFEGGHIGGAHNLYTPALVQNLLLHPTSGGRRILVFHCEFSIERGPKLYRYLRSSDRSKNAENYPNLTYPEVYLLHQGYRNFYQKYPELCSPGGYTAMLDPKHSHLLKKHRSIGEPSSFFTHHRKGHRLMY